MLRSLIQEHPAFAMPTAFSLQRIGHDVQYFLSMPPYFLSMEETDPAREQKSALLTRMVLSVEAGIEIDFRMVDSLLALVRNL